jgi:ubiquinone/menaquinone biosynthesis C-methylase UbiE
MKRFYDQYEHGFILDVGCGNGKNVVPEDAAWYELCDLSDSFVQMCKTRFEESGICQVNASALPYRESVFDTVISVAVLHHLDSFNKRLQMLNEMIRVCKKNGRVFFTVWAADSACDRMIPWKDVKSQQTYMRFYHLFDKSEIHRLVMSANISMYDIYFEHNNYICTLSVT